MSDPKADCDELLNFVMPFAEQMLSKRREFFPFGAAMRASGEIVPVQGRISRWRRPKSADLIRQIKDAFIDAARKGEYKATAVAYDMRVTLPSSGKQSDAIAVSADHRDGYSAIVVFPYSLDGGEVTLDVPLGYEGEADIFPR
jgi:hypothetical protein